MWLKVKRSFLKLPNILLCYLKNTRSLLFSNHHTEKQTGPRGDSFTGIGDIKALKILADVRQKYSVPVITDIHNPEEAAIAAEYVDVLQIPAFLMQTD